ncbi:F-type H+-transporting ATPase subunit b [Mycobacterium frederiksbergense]|uniref:ATP synthase subunit b n=1 Tax=Mycolicibacterium frederiksbergense TaxID=117567 RepID=A0ABT6L3B2_9MYCO|nr:F0F1 ATP synthase subunit B [Mycolicibacterium frederiksbergense]MDH6197424.1 F-type H+-transporting ATPase subunit b [Mycolicibacterium frederiksbergense]
MSELSATILAASQAAGEGGGGQSNFLVPNGTFFAVLIIFLIVLGVIAKWVVPPVGKVLAEREAMLAKTAANNRKSAEQVAAAQADYDEAMAGARTQASAIRDEARAAGREVVEAKRAEAGTEVAQKVSQADEQLAAQSAQVRSGLESSVDGLAQTLAGRILGVDVKSGGTQ